jgi:RNA polymerase sigma-70 factor (ECF subfamily)
MPDNQRRSLVEQLQVQNAERLLIERAQSGDEDAFADLYAQNFVRVRAVVRSILWGRPDADVEDVVASVFGKAFCQIHAYRCEGAFFTWLYPIARNEAMELLRKRAAERVDIDEAIESIPSSEDVEKLVWLQECRQLVGEVLDTLTDLERRVVEMVRDGHDRKGIAETLGISVKEVYVITDRFKKKGRALAALLPRASRTKRQ